MTPANISSVAESTPKWAKVIDNTRCIGCHACTVACKSENEVPLSVTRTYVKYVDVGAFPTARRVYQVTRCNQCEDAPCTVACPTGAMFRRPDGIVDFDKSICIGCKACIAACPYDAIFINPEDHSAEKCNFCAHRIDRGMEPACVVVCPTEAIIVGDMNDPFSLVAQIIHRDAVTVRRPEKETLPKLFYKGAHQATLDPLAAERPAGGLFMWSEQGNAAGQVPSGQEHGRNSSAAAILAYDVPHQRPWDFRVSLYTWTKSIAAGVYLIPLFLALTGFLSWSSAIWQWGTPVLGLTFLLATVALLIWDLEHPARFYMVLTRPQWQSWLVRGGIILTAFGGVLALHLVGSITGNGVLSRQVAWAGLPLALAAAVYTAYLFAQCKARDLWQSPLLPPHFVLQALLLGAGALALWAPGDSVVPLLLEIFALGSFLHLVLLGGEASQAHPTAHARQAAREMVCGRFAGYFWTGIVLVGFGALAPWMGLSAVVAGMVGVLLHEHAFVQAGQSVPLA